MSELELAPGARLRLALRPELELTTGRDLVREIGGGLLMDEVGAIITY